ncbi:hypothetical protein ACIBCM_33105 [Streptomyces sp. NPDC051018]|uniref:hypothetical protein n=1 Tax=Streptomyces sp. NPDC051018 TaxID=3365639 RepID=UPI0037A76128
MGAGTGAGLQGRIAEQRAGSGDPRALVGELRRTLLLVPLDGGGLWTARSGGVRWICGFTDEGALARFALAHQGTEGAAPDDYGRGQNHGHGHGPAGAVRSWEYAALRGARLLDEIIPAMGEPAGIAVDIADPDGSMVFPPVKGIVPDAVAVDADEPHGGRG